MVENSSSVSHIANISTCLEHSPQHSILIELVFLLATVTVSLILSAMGVALNRRHHHHHRHNHPPSIIHRLRQRRLAHNVEEASAQL